MKKLMMVVTLMAASFSSFSSMIHFPINEHILNEIEMSSNLKHLNMVLNDGEKDHYFQTSFYARQVTKDGDEFDQVGFSFNKDKKYQIEMQIFKQRNYTCIYEFYNHEQSTKRCIADSQVWQD